MKNGGLNIYLARHGEDEDNANGILNGRRDMPLTREGGKPSRDIGEKNFLSRCYFR